MINRANFYNNYRLNFGKISSSQVKGYEAIFNEWDNRKLKDTRWLAYMLATTYHETAKTIAPIEEYGKGKTRSYGKKIKHSGVAYTAPEKIYYGRGFVQLTWYENYELLGRLLKLNLLKNPELCLTLEVATKVMFEGMLKGSSNVGDFTGKCLEMYFNEKTEDAVGARKIINGTDKADLIASYYLIFKKCLS